VPFEFSPHNQTMPCVLTRRHWGQLVMAGLALPSLSACSNPAVQLLTQRSLSLSREQLQAALAKRFPMEQRVADVLDVRLPDAGFYLWAGVPGGDDVAYALGLLAQYNVAVLPGSLLARPAHGLNPGAGRIRLALVAGTEECVEAAERIVQFTKEYRPS
jgi:aspartate/methionine/tyrosine aminotransferase